MYSNTPSTGAYRGLNNPNPSQHGQSPFIHPQQTGYQDSGGGWQPTGAAGPFSTSQNPGLGHFVASYEASPQQPQFTGAPNQAQPSGARSTQAAPSASNTVGQTSSDIAQSFRAMESSPAPSTPKPSAGVKIPSDRLSFLTLDDQIKFTNLFRSAVGDGQALDGDKVRDLLIRSKLPGRDLMHIWTLSDTTKSGKLLFPEFALAMYLCNLKIVGKDLPQSLPERIANEVSDMVDKISFGVPDEQPGAPVRSNVPNFEVSSQQSTSTGIRQPQPQASNAQLLSQLTAQPTGFAAQYIPPQPTGLQPQMTAPSHQNSFHQVQMQTPQMTGAFQQQSMPSGMASFGTGQLLNAARNPPTSEALSLGLVNAPVSGLPNIDELHRRMMPQAGREGGFTTAGLAGNATVPWAVTKEEKKIYDQLFRAWDGLNKGFIGGETAIELMGQSGLAKPDLERIWTLSDPNNRGRLDMDEFAVAMHLIYRRLNGYSVPNRLPPELVPPSTRNFADSIGTVKSLLSQDAQSRKVNGTFLEPQKTGISYLKNHSFRTGSAESISRKDATVFRNNDDDFGYKSSARRRVGAGARSPSPASVSSQNSVDEISLNDLRKKVRENEVMLGAIDLQDEAGTDENEQLDRADRREAEDLRRRVRRIQESIDSHPDASFRIVDMQVERRALNRRLQALTDRLPELASKVRRTERDISDVKLELFRLKDTKDHPRSANSIVGTGPGGSVTEADRLKARAKAMMQQRSAALTGKVAEENQDDLSATSRRQEEEMLRARTEKENNERMIRDVEESVRDFSRGIESGIQEHDQSPKDEHETRRWEDGLGVEDEVQEFIFDLQRSSRAVKARKHESRKEIIPADEFASAPYKKDELSKATGSPKRRQESPAPTNTSYATYRTAEERAAFVKQQAEQRMAERLAALGLKAPVQVGESAQQKEDRGRKEREERARQAETAENQRKEERQKRLADEAPRPPASQKLIGKKPPPPPSRGTRSGSLHDKQKTQGPTATRRDEKEETLKLEQEKQAAQTRDLESEARRQEDILAKEKQDAEVRLKALEEQYKAGKLKKQGEKRKRQAAQKEARETEQRLAAQRAELEAAKERERQLQSQLEQLGDEDSSEDEDAAKSAAISAPDTFQPNAEAPASREEPKPMPPKDSPSQNISEAQATISKLPTASYHSETKNPFFKQLSQSADPHSIPPPGAPPIASLSPAEPTKNPFYRLSQQEAGNSSVQKPSEAPIEPRSRSRPEEDDWSAMDSTEESSEDEDGAKPAGGSAKQLASMLFGTMGPPRPLSAMDEKVTPSPARNGPEHAIAAPIPPSREANAVAQSPNAIVPQSERSTANTPGAPPAPGPPPPPPIPGALGMPSQGAPAAPPPPPPPAPVPSAEGSQPTVGALLGEIQKGKGLKKVETKDRSQASGAGTVLG